MADEQPPSPIPVPPHGMFAEPVREKHFPKTALVIASVAIIILIVFFGLMHHRKNAPAGPAMNAPQAAASYASNLPLSNIEMSESESISGGKVMYIDGRIANHGPSPVVGVTAQVLFANDQGMPPQVMTVPLNLIRMREPYIDTQPISAAPLVPGAEADFRLIFEGVAENWNQKQPEIRLVRVTTR